MWEYHIDHPETFKEDHFQGWLNAKGYDRWELVTINMHGDCVFKIKIEE